MAYDNDFYRAYETYLGELRVRKCHDIMFSMFQNEVGKYNNVVDIGCGVFNEFNTFYRPKHYTGIDLNADIKDRTKDRNNNALFIQGNYRDRAFLDAALHTDKLVGDAEAFVSLFSSEITAPAYENYELYNHLFETCPNIRAGLVSGFYYSDKIDINPVTEAGGLISYQTLDPLESFRSQRFSETRILMPVPSNMFGDNVVEVWKIFNRILRPEKLTNRTE